MKWKVISRIVWGGGRQKRRNAKRTTYFQRHAYIRNKIYSLFSKTNRHRCKTDDHRCKTNSPAMNERKESCKKVSGEILPWRKQNPYKTSIG